MDQVIALDLSVRRAIQQHEQGVLNNAQGVLKGLEARFSQVRRFKIPCANFDDEIQVLESQLALLKQLLQEDGRHAKTAVRPSAVEEDITDEDIVVGLIGKLLSEKGQVVTQPDLESPIAMPRTLRSRRSQPPAPQNENPISTTASFTTPTGTASAGIPFIDDLSQMLVSHGSALKKHTQDFAKLLSDDSKALEETQRTMSNAGDKFHKESGNLKVIRARRPSLLSALTQFAMVLLAFFLMYIFIKLT